MSRPARLSYMRLRDQPFDESVPILSPRLLLSLPCPGCKRGCKRSVIPTEGAPDLPDQGVG